MPKNKQKNTWSEFKQFQNYVNENSKSVNNTIQERFDNNNSKPF